MNNSNLLGLLQAPTVVASSDLLGCRLRVIWLILFVAWLVVLILWLRALSAYAKNYREYEQARRQQYECARELNKRVGLPLQSPAGNLGKLGSADKNLRIFDSNQRPSIISARILRKARNLLPMSLDFVLKFFRRHKSNKRKQPNEKS